ncbi:MAG: ATPase [Hyphomicrobiales bacterium]|nr:MAG: ATPase [Hyphomicrobiales bacterium]
MTSRERFKPGTVYVTYIAAAPEAVWQALVDRTFTQQYFFGLSIDIEPRTGGAFRLLMPDGSAHVTGDVIAWEPPRRLDVTWQVAGMKGFDALPACLVSYEIEPAGACVRLTMTESHSWAIPEAILQGGRSGWPQILSSLKSLLETGKPLQIEKKDPPAGFLAAVEHAVATKPWLREDRG